MLAGGATALIVIWALQDFGKVPLKQVTVAPLAEQTNPPDVVADWKTEPAGRTSCTTTPDTAAPAV